MATTKLRFTDVSINIGKGWRCLVCYDNVLNKGRNVLLLDQIADELEEFLKSDESDETIDCFLKTIIGG